MPNTLLSVPEFAELAGVSTQAIYQQASNPKSKLAPYVGRTGRKIGINPAALTDLYGVEQPEDPSLTTNASQEKQNPTSLTRDYVDFLKLELSNLQERNKELNNVVQAKDELIKDQAAQLADLARQVTEIANKALTATSQQQQLAALDKAPLTESQAKTTDLQEKSTESQEKSTQKQGFWKRLFG